MQRPISKRANMAYGWWLSPNGAIHSVEDRAHSDFVSKHPEIFGDILSSVGDYRAVALNKGWIRVVSGKDSLGFQTPDANDKYLITIQAALDKLPEVKTIYVDAGRLHLVVPYSEFVGCNGWNELTKYDVKSDLDKFAAIMAGTPK